MRGQMPAWAQIGDVRVVDGDDLEWQGRRYRLDGFDAPEVHSFRSRYDRGLEEKRGLKAMNRLAVLLKGARSVHLLEVKLIARDRILAVALVDGRDVASIAVEEGWGVRFVRQPDGSLKGRQQNDWGDSRTPFPDHLPLPDGLSEVDDDP